MWRFIFPICLSTLLLTHRAVACVVGEQNETIFGSAGYCGSNAWRHAVLCAQTFPKLYCPFPRNVARIRVLSADFPCRNGYGQRLFGGVQRGNLARNSRPLQRRRWHKREVRRQRTNFFYACASTGSNRSFHPATGHLAHFVRPQQQNSGRNLFGRSSCQPANGVRRRNDNARQSSNIR